MAARGLAYQNVRNKLDFFKSIRFNIPEQFSKPQDYQCHAEIKIPDIP